MKRLLLLLVLALVPDVGLTQVVTPPASLGNWPTANTALTLADPATTNQVAGWDNTGKKFVWVTNASGGGGGNVSNSGTPTVGQMAQWVTATTVKGVTLSGSGATISIDTAGVLSISAIPNTSLSNSAITIAGTSTSLGGTISRDTITGVSSNGIYQRTAANTYGIATAKTDYWDTSNFVASGASHAKGLVPDPGATAGTTKFLREDATWQVPAGGGSGTVTATGGSLTSNAVVLGAGTTDTKVVAGIFTDGTAKLTLGQASTSTGSLVFGLTGGGTTTLSPTNGTLTSTFTVPAVAGGGTDTLVGKATTDILTNKTLTTPHIGSGTNVVFDTPGGGTLSIAATNSAAVRVFTLPNIPDDTFVFKASTDTLTNKTLSAPHVASGTNLVFDTVTGFTFSITPGSTGASRTFTLPNVPDDTFAFVAATQTLTNKTLTSPVINTPTGIVKGDVGLGNVDNTSDASKNSATVTLTNKRINPRVDTSTSASATTWAPNADTTDVFELAGALTAAVTTISNPSGTPVEGQKLMIRVKSDASPHALTWSGSQWRASTASGAPALPATTTASKNFYAGFIWNSTDSKWDLVAVQDGY